MPRRYFDKFPEIDYNGVRARDITRSAHLVNKYVNLPYSYYSYDVGADLRPDNVADDYYDDPYMSWLIFYANRTLDPYYEWHLQEDSFYAFVDKKYGSLERADRTILGYRNNWATDRRELKPSQFEAMFGDYTHPHSQYWNTVYADDGRRLLWYIRKDADMVVGTNRLVKVRVDDLDQLQEDDLLDVKDGGAVVGKAQVESIRDDYLYLKNIVGPIANGYSLESFLTGNEVNIVAHGDTSDTSEEVWTIVNIPDEEFVYWEPFSALDVERERNEANRTIKLVDPATGIRVADRLEEELR